MAGEGGNQNRGKDGSNAALCVLKLPKMRPYTSYLCSSEIAFHCPELAPARMGGCCGVISPVASTTLDKKLRLG